jgi:hypothetical protein
MWEFVLLRSLSGMIRVNLARSARRLVHIGVKPKNRAFLAIKDKFGIKKLSSVSRKSQNKFLVVPKTQCKLQESAKKKFRQLMNKTQQFVRLKNHIMMLIQFHVRSAHRILRTMMKKFPNVLKNHNKGKLVQVGVMRALLPSPSGMKKPKRAHNVLSELYLIAPASSVFLIVHVKKVSNSTR